MAIGFVAAKSPVLAVAGVVAMGFALLVIERPAVGAITLAVAVPPLAGLGRGIPIPQLKLVEAMTIAVAVLVVGVAGRHRRLDAVDTAALTYVAATAVLTVVHPLSRGEWLSIDDMRDAFSPALFFLMYWTIRCASLTRRQRAAALSCLVASSVASVLVGVGQYLDVPGVRSFVANITSGGIFDTWSYQNTSVGARATGLYENWHSFAGFLVPLLLVCVAVLVDRQVSRPVRRAAFTMAIVIAGGLMLSQALTAIAVTVVMVLAISMSGGRAGRSLVAIALVGIAAFSFAGGALTNRIEQQYDPTSGTVLGKNIDDRLAIWSGDYEAPLSEYWPLGFGPGIPPGVDWQHTESLYVTLVLRGGVLLLGSYLVFMSIAAGAAWRHRHGRAVVDRAVSLTLVAVIPGSLVMHFIFPYFTSSGFPHVFWVLLALLPRHHAPSDLHPNRAGDAAGDLEQLPAGWRRDNVEYG